MGRVPVVAPWLALLLMTAIVLAHAGLLPLGRWQGDEYIQCAFARDFGFSYFWSRLTGVSPRPVSEAVLFAYCRAATALGRPLIAPFLLLHWLLLAAACFAGMRWPPNVWRLLLGAALLCLFVLGHDITELFFWPAGVAPYLDTLAAVTLLLLLTLDGRAEAGSGRLAAAACATVAAACSEMGAMFALPYAALRLIAGPRRPAAVWCVPLLAATAVLAAIVLSPRLAGHETGAPAEAATLHRVLPSLLAALPQFAGELFGLDDAPPTFSAIAQGVAIKLLALLAFRWCWRLAAPAAGRPPGLLIFAAAAVAGGFAAIVAAEYQFGAICCSRHAALRQCLFVLAIAALGAVVAPERVAPGARVLAPVFLLVAAAVAFLPRASSLPADYRLRSAAVAARSATWASGQSAGPTMVWRPPPSGKIVRGPDLPPGHFALADNPPWWVFGILRFFGKREVEIEAAAPH